RFVYLLPTWCYFLWNLRSQSPGVHDQGEASVLPDVTLLLERPAGAEAPTGYWLSNLPDTLPLAELVRLANYRELKHGLGPDHFGGRTWTGWHRHVTLVTAAHAFLTEQRLAPKADTADSPSSRSSTPSKIC
ncbi:hypothetical protein ACIBL8_48545, partial [Streptomyces sp. NPDC050523]